MKTFEGTFTVKWGKNHVGSKRPLTIDCENFGVCKLEMLRIKDAFMTHGEDASVADIFGTKSYIGVPATYVTFDVHERN